MMRNRRRISDGQVAKEDTLQQNHQQYQQKQHVSLSGSVPTKFFRWYWFTLHFVSICMSICGAILCAKVLHTATECDMTWSRPKFIEISSIHNVNNNASSFRSKSYKLFKFVDQRDPRFASTLSKFDLVVSDDDSHCDFHAPNIVLYVPGHGGSYKQARSVGAHGLQLTRRYARNKKEETLILDKIQSLSSSSSSSVNDNGNNEFFYDVYSIDFNEEGGGYHGAILHRQADFLSRCVQYLNSVCGIPSITIVAHSIGGISARLALQNHPHRMESVQNVVTLGTPHSRPLLSFEPTMHSIYRNLPPVPNRIAMVSISAGIRDEMIPPELCEVGDNHNEMTNLLTVLASEIMSTPIEESKGEHPVFGMDHRAIVWCHNLLSEVRSDVLRVLLMSSDASSQSRIANVTAAIQYNTTKTYQQSVHDTRIRLERRYGHLRASLLQTSVLVNVELVVSIYSILASIRWAFGFTGSDSFSSLFIPPIVVVCGMHIMNALVRPLVPVSLFAIACLVFVADTILLVLRALLAFFIGTPTPATTQRKHKLNDTFFVAWVIVLTPILLLGDVIASIQECSIHSFFLLAAAMLPPITCAVTSKCEQTCYGKNEINNADIIRYYPSQFVAVLGSLYLAFSVFATSAVLKELHPLSNILLCASMIKAIPPLIKLFS